MGKHIIDMELQGVVYKKIKWKDYLVPANNPRIIRFLRSNGSLVYEQISNDIKRALEEKDLKVKEILIAVHKNSIHLVSIPKEEFGEFLDHGLEWFLKREEYEQCAVIRDLKNRIDARKART